MKIVASVSIAGDGFDYSLGDVVDETEFSKRVGAGWESLCAPFDELERAVKPSAPEMAVKHRGSRGKRQ